MEFAIYGTMATMGLVVFAWFIIACWQAANSTNEDLGLTARQYIFGIAAYLFISLIGMLGALWALQQAWGAF